MKLGKIIVIGTGASILQSKGIGKQIRKDSSRINKLNVNTLKREDCIGTIDSSGNVTFY